MLLQERLSVVILIIYNMQAQYIYVDLRINNHNKTVNHHILIIKNYELLV
jgi:hypothetical protein